MADDDSSMSRTFEYQQAIDPSLVKHLVDFEEVIDSLRLIFAGKDIDYSTTPPQVVEFGSPLMNQFGISRVVTKLKIIHKGIPIATFNDKTPYIYTRIMALNLAKELFDNWELYGITSTADADKLVEITMASMMAAFSRAVAGGEKTFIKGFARENRALGQGGKGRLSL